MATEETTVPASTGWKPDFTRDNPWEGMPQEYVEREAAVFKPTEEYPLPPSQRTPEGIAAREAAPTASAEFASIKLSPESTPDKPLFSQEDYDRFQRLQDKEKFVKAVELGLMPEGSKYAPGLKVTYGEGVPVEERTLKPTEWGYYTPEQVAEIEKAEAETKAAYEARVADIGAAREAIESRQARELAEFEATHTLRNGEWYSTELLETFEANLENMPPDLQLAYKEGGFELYEKSAAAYDEAVEKLKARQEKVMETLEPYGVPLEGALEEEIGGYNIALFLKANPEKEWMLHTAGFSKEDIARALEPEVPVEPIITPQIASTVKDLDRIAKEGTMTEAQSLIDAIRTANLYERTVIGTLREKTWGELTEDEKVMVAASYAAPGDIVGQAGQLFTGMTKLMYKAPTPSLLEGKVDKNLVPLTISEEYHKEYLNADPFRRLELLIEAGLVEKGSTLAGVDEDKNPTYHPPAEPWTTAKVATIAGEVIVPFMYVARHKKELTAFGIITYLVLDVLSLLPLIGWAGKVGAVSVRTMPAATRGARAWQVARSAWYATSTIPKGMVLFPYNLVRHPIRTVRGLASITVEPVFHPIRTTKTLASISTGKVQLGNIIPAGTVVTMAGAGRTVPLRTGTGAQLNVTLPTVKKPVSLKPSKAYLRAQKAGKLPFVTSTKMDTVKVSAGDVSQATYNRLLAEGKLPVSTIYDPKGKIIVKDPLTGMPFTYTERVPTFTEWSVRPTTKTVISTAKSFLTPAEYEVYRTMTSIKGWAPPPDLANLDTVSAARVRAASVQNVVFEHGYQTAIKMYGKNFIKAVFPDYVPKLKAELAIQKILAPEQAVERTKINKQVTKYVYENLLGGTVGSEAEWNKLAANGFLQSPDPTTTLVELVYPGRMPALAELARIPCTYSVTTGGAWKVEPMAGVPTEGLTLKYPVYITDPSMISDIWALRTGTITPSGETLPKGFVESEAEWKRLMAAGFLEAGEKIEIEEYRPKAEIELEMFPDPIPPVEAEEPVTKINPVTGEKEPGELMQLLQNNLIFIEFAPGTYTIKSTGEMIALAGENYEAQATYLYEAIKKMVEEEGYGKTLAIFGYLPTLAVYPYAIEMALAEEEVTWDWSAAEREIYINRMIRIFKEQGVLDKLSPTTAAKVLESLEGMAERFSKAGMPKQIDVTPSIPLPLVIEPGVIHPEPEAKLVWDKLPIQPKVTTLAPGRVEVAEAEPARIALAEKVSPKVVPKIGTVIPPKEPFVGLMPKEEPITIEFPIPIPPVMPERVIVPAPIRYPAIALEPELEPAKVPWLEQKGWLFEEPVEVKAPEPIKELVPEPTKEPVVEPIPIPTPEPTPVPVPTPMPIPVPTPKPIPTPEPEPIPIPEPEPIEPIIPPPPEEPIIPPPVPEIEAVEELVKKPPKGTITWRQGLFWIILPPPYTKRHYSKKSPEGAYKFAVGEDSAYKTIQAIGGMPTKDIRGIDIGIAIVDITRKDKELKISFKRDVEDVYKGKTIAEKIPKPSIDKPRKARQPRPTSLAETSKPKKQVRLPKVATINDRFYLGHRLRPSELKVAL